MYVAWEKTNSHMQLFLHYIYIYIFYILYYELFIIVFVLRKKIVNELRRYIQIKKLNMKLFLVKLIYTFCIHLRQNECFIYCWTDIINN
jgi:hypothetical protein